MFKIFGITFYGSLILIESSDLVLLEENRSVNDDDQLENEEGKSDEHEAENLTTSVGNNETILNIFSAFFCGSNVGIDGDSHSDVARNDGGESTNNEGNSCVTSPFVFSWLYSEVKEN